LSSSSSSLSSSTSNTNCYKKKRRLRHFEGIENDWTHLNNGNSTTIEHRSSSPQQVGDISSTTATASVSSGASLSLSKPTSLIESVIVKGQELNFNHTSSTFASVNYDNDLLSPLISHSNKQQQHRHRQTVSSRIRNSSANGKRVATNITTATRLSDQQARSRSINQSHNHRQEFVTSAVTVTAASTNTNNSESFVRASTIKLLDTYQFCL